MNYIYKSGEALRTFSSKMPTIDKSNSCNYKFLLGQTVYAWILK